MAFIHTSLRSDWSENREACIKRFRLIATREFDPLNHRFLGKAVFAVAVEQDGIAEHAERYVRWAGPRLTASHIAVAMDLDGVLLAVASNPPDLNAPWFESPLELIKEGEGEISGFQENAAAFVDRCIMRPFSACYYTLGWYGNSCRVPADIVLVPEGNPPPHDYEAYLHQFGCHSSRPTTLEETASQLEDHLGIDLPRPLPFAPTYEDLAYRTKCSVEEVEERLRESLYDYDFERREVMIDDVRTGWDVYAYEPGVGFRWGWYPDS